MARGKTKTFDERFWPKIEFDPFGGCWLWSACTNPKTRYAVLRQPTGVKSQILVHRASYEHFVGPIPKGMFIDHKCRVRSCVNPAHLRAVTPRQNCLENSAGEAATNAAKTHCDHGHELTEKNTYRWTRPDGNVMRSCRKCGVIRQQEYRARQAARALSCEEV